MEPGASDYDFALPQELIAQHPAPRRDGARLMLLRQGAPEHHLVPDLPDLIEAHVGPGALLVVNDTRVIPARLHGRKPQGGKVELLLCDPLGASEQQVPWREVWRCLYRSSKPLRPGTTIALDGERPPEALVLENEGQGRVQVALTGHEPGGLLALLDRIGQVPLPPYIARPAAPEQPQEDDRQRYQTVYATHPGAVAAPTAGLHFTEELLGRLAERGVRRVAITLHVGPGTFAPLTAERLEDHVMHAERYHVPVETAAAIAQARAEGRKLVAVGTTVVRTLESATPEGQSVPAAGWGQTRLFLRPPYRFRAVDALLTNFHLPRSTLLMLVSALAGRRRVLSAYAEAVQKGYRFFSYGDAMLIPAQMEDEHP